MDQDVFFQACDSLAERPELSDQRAITYHASYPALLQFFRESHPLDSNRLLGLATMVYGWMPRIVRVDLTHVNRSLEAIRTIRTKATLRKDTVEPIANLLSSAVGASKLLHFLFPDKIAIWDSRIEGRRLGKEAKQYHMSSSALLIYEAEMMEMLGAPWIPGLREQFDPAFTQRLSAHGIDTYGVSDIRMLEYLLFEPVE